jgi:hypothetical protein
MTSNKKPATGGPVNGLGTDDHAAELISSSLTELPSQAQDGKRACRSRGLSHSERRYLLSREREESLATRIRSYWQHRGVIAHIWVEPLNEKAIEWCVRSSQALSLAMPRP